MLELFQKGGPIMWPLLVTSFVSIAVTLERILYYGIVFLSKDEKSRQGFFDALERSDFNEAEKNILSSKDFVNRMLFAGVRERSKSISLALTHQAQVELQPFSRGLAVLDVIVTLAPLLGLLGTIIGMIGSFSLLGGTELGAPTQITGGIAEALIATAFGLCVAIVTIIPSVYFNEKLEQARRDLEREGTKLELTLSRCE